MLKEGKFGRHEAVCLLVITISIKAFFSSPAMVVNYVGNAGWYMTIISALTAAFLFMFQYLLLKRFPGKNIMEIIDIVLGKFLGSILLFLMALFLISIAAMNLREFAEILKVYVLPDTPPSFLLILFLLCVVVLSFLGLETIARYAKYVFYVLLSGYILVLLLSVTNFVPKHLYPIGGYGLLNTLVHGLLRCSAYGEVALVGIIASSLQGIKEIKRIGYISLLLSGIFISASVLAFNLVFPYTVSQELTSPMYDMAALISIGGFLQRLDPIFLFLWNFATFTEVSLLFYSSMMVYCHIFNISDKRPIIMPMVTLLFAISFIPESISVLVIGVVQTLRNLGGVFYFVPSILVLIIAVIRKKKGEGYNG